MALVYFMLYDFRNSITSHPMRRVYLLVLLLLFNVGIYSQALSHIALTGGTTLSSFSFITDQQVIIRISQDGKVLEWGTEMEPFRYRYYPGKLIPYMGRVEYYGPGTDSAYKGKVKSIGTCLLNYYGSTEYEEKKGKLKSIGSVTFDYYSNFDDKAFRGRIKFAGSSLISYYGSYENEYYRGKLKSVGNIPLTYYSSFDDKIIRGKIKSIGMYNYIWYTSMDRYRGGLKSGSLEQRINGVMYIVR